MFRTRSITIAATAVAITGGGTAAMAAQSAMARPAHAASAAVLKVGNVKLQTGGSSKAQKLLVNSAGKPVYLLTGDSTRHPECTSSACLSAWPAVTTSAKKAALGKGVSGKVGVWRHKGINQVTLNGHPIYLFAADSAGSASGQGLKSFGGTWELLKSNGKAVA